MEIDSNLPMVLPLEPMMKFSTSLFQVSTSKCNNFMKCYFMVKDQAVCSVMILKLSKFSF